MSNLIDIFSIKFQDRMFLINFNCGCILKIIFKWPTSDIIDILMPRFGGSRNRSSSPPPRQAPTASRPATQAPPQPAMQQAPSTGFGGGFGSTIMQGMAFGAGSEVAHQAVRGVMGGNSHSAQQQPANTPQQAVNMCSTQPQQQNACMNEANLFTNCLRTNSDISYCQQFSDMLKQCQQNLQL